ncbi:hypothetical protein AGLY_013205 [Aphis glycines]|uniref:Uncharacterized protein n=1 Tax=Aphis glycines TaxID=307491 RepID=A0A6G0T5U1_APHGL|nr:hypothetical protein AGLY_013205 [Aphis glycines]
MYVVINIANKTGITKNCFKNVVVPSNLIIVIIKSPLSLAVSVVSSAARASKALIRYITTAFRHHTNSSLRVWCLERINIMDKWMFCRSYSGNITPLLVSNSTITIGSSNLSGDLNEYCLSESLLKPVQITKYFERLGAIIPNQLSFGDKLNPQLIQGRTIKAPPPADSTMQATNFGFTAQNVESHEDLDTRIFSRSRRSAESYEFNAITYRV